MVVQHNLTAMNSNRMLSATTSTQAKSTEKLSSGYKINRAADDAAGLSISEKMRKQIRGLTQASSNAQDGISAVQTAEGALNEVQDMLQRMNELAVKAANGTMSENDRSYVQNEVDQLVTEVDRVAETTKFNETYLLKGNGETQTSNVAAHDAGFVGKLTDNGDGTSTFALDKALENGDTIKIAGKDYTIGTKEASTDGYMDLATLNAKKVSVGDSVTYKDGDGKEVTKTLVDKAENADAIYAEGSTFKIGDKEYNVADATNLGTNAVKISDATALVADALAKGETVTLTKTGAELGIYAVNAETEIEIVGRLAEGEVSSLKGAGLGPTTNAVSDFASSSDAKGGGLAAGDVVTLSGVSYKVTAEKPANINTVKDVVKSLQKGDKFTIGTASAITIADKTNVAEGKYTLDDALALINEGDKVTFTTGGGNIASTEGQNALTTSGLKSGTSYTVVDTKSTGADNVISVKEAYSMITKELQDASSIGTDTAAEVKSNGTGSFTITQGTVETKKSLAMNLHVGADADTTNKIGMEIKAMDAAGLGIKGISVSDATGTKATYAIDAIADAIQTVSAQRSALGAIQNRLEHTITNLDNVVENTTSAESAIRDTDMATEMVKYSNNNILAQAGQAMLAQANQSNQGVLSLLQ